MCKQRFVSSLSYKLALLEEMVNSSISCYFFRFSCASFILQDKAFWKTEWLLKLPKLLWYQHGSLLGDLNFQVLVQSSVAVDIKAWREWRYGKLLKGFASYTDQPWGFVYCRGEKMAVAVVWGNWCDFHFHSPIRAKVFFPWRFAAWHQGSRVMLAQAS